MAATTATSYTEVANLIQGYAAAFLPEQLSLVQSGACRIENNPGGDFAQGSTYTVRYRNYNSGDWNTPTANTDSTIDAFTGSNETGVIFRRYKDLGLEDFARLSSGDLNAVQDMARMHAHNAALALENQAFDLVGTMFETGGALLDTTYHYVNAAGSLLTNSNIVQAKALYGEYGAQFEFLFMHSRVFYATEISALTQAEPDYDTIREFQGTGMAYMGKLGGLKVILNDRCPVSGTTYDTYLMRRNALMLAYQQPLQFKAYRDERVAAGTDVLRYTIAASLHIPGVSWAGTTPSGLGGVTDAALGTATNWSKRTSVDAKEIGIACIKSDVV